MAEEPKAKFTRIDEGVYADERRNVYEEREGKLVPTGVKLVETKLAEPPPEAGIIPRFDQIAMDAAIQNYQALSEVLKKNMKRGHHYGKFPGWQKDQLLEPGASLILNGFKLYSDPIRVERVEDEDGHFRYNIVVYLRFIGRPDLVVAAGVGSASTREIKYAYRWVEEGEVPKDLDKDELRTKSGFQGKTLYRIPNEDPGDLENTLLKMATKRAEIDAVNHLPGVSELFPSPQAE